MRGNPRELDHRGEIELFRDLSDLANAIGSGLEILGRHFPVRDGWTINLLEADRRKLLAPPFPCFERCSAGGSRYPNVRQHGSGRYRRQAEIGANAFQAAKAVEL